jgi:hypothetical protein
MSGIYNSSLFEAKSRPARNKLARMGGIMASSTELMEAAMPQQQQPTAMTPRQPMPMMQQMPMTPQPMQQQMPPVQPMPTAPVPQPVPQPAQQAAPVRMAEGGSVSAAYQNYDPRLAGRVDIGQDPMQFMQGLQQSAEQIQEGGGAVVSGKVKSIQQAANSGDKEQVQAAITSAVGTSNDKKGLEEAYEAAVGQPAPKNASIDELNDRIMTVAMGGALAQPGSTADRFAKAMIFGLQQKRDTAVARAAGAAGAGGQSISPLEPFPDAVRDLAGKLIANQGMNASEAMAAAQAALAPLYQQQMDGAPVAPPPSGKPTLEQFLAAAVQQNPGATTEQLTEYYQKTYGG